MHKLRDLTSSWSRYDYRGRILEADTLEDVLDAALEHGYRWCLVQRPGHVILESWHADPGRRSFAQCVSQWIGDQDFFARGAFTGGDDCMLVDLERSRERGRSALVGLAPAHDAPRLSLGALPPPELQRLARYLGRGIRSYAGGDTWAQPGVDHFLREVRLQVVSADRGVFLWNLEPYDDVQAPPRGFEPPVSTLYTVASGFKPNMMLESLGFDGDTRVVFFDCSRRALEVKRFLVEEWDGRDFPAFTRRLFRTLPATEAHYHLWDGATPETLDESLMVDAWDRELERWGGERAFEQHWSRYRRLRHEFVCCDVLSDPAPLLARVRPERDAVIWWSNAFFTVWGNWLLDAGERRRAYERWVEELAERNGDLFLYGSDFCNSSVNDVQASDYRSLLREGNYDELEPLAANAYEIRF